MTFKGYRHVVTRSCCPACKPRGTGACGLAKGCPPPSCCCIVQSSRNVVENAMLLQGRGASTARAARRRLLDGLLRYLDMGGRLKDEHVRSRRQKLVVGRPHEERLPRARPNGDAVAMLLFPSCSCFVATLPSSTFSSSLSICCSANMSDSSFMAISARSQA